MRFPAHIMTDTIQNSVRNVLRGNKRYPFVLMLEPLYTCNLACIGCAICLTVCSDAGGLIWEHDKVTGIDTAFCKGCMRCVEVCPATGRGQALTLPQSVSRMEVRP